MKRRQVRPGAIGGFLAISVLLATASAVWACTAQPRIFSLGPQVGPVGLEITLEGEAPGGGPVVGSAVPVEVRWNSLDGPKIGEGVTAFNGTFAVKARIPQAEPGIYFLVVKAGDAGVVRSPFEVTGERAIATAEGSGPRTTASSADLWQGFSESARAEQAANLAATGEGSGAQAAIGGALLVAGLVILSSGLVMAGRRRRALLDHRREPQS